MKLLVFCLIASSLALLVSAQNGTCSGSSCASCKANGGSACGWCQSNIGTPSCLPGDASGASGGACRLQDDEWQYTCPDLCGGYDTCEECHDAGCGWCFDSNSCKTSQGSCQTWAATGSSCVPPTACKDYLFCTTCATSKGLSGDPCKWCEEDQKCYDMDDTATCGSTFVTDSKVCPKIDAGSTVAPIFALCAAMLAFVIALWL